MLSGVMWLVTRRRPLVFFGLPGAFLLSVGMAVGLWVVYTYLRAHNVVIEYVLISVSLCIGGTLILCTGAILYSIQELITTLAQTNREVAYKPRTSSGVRQLVKWSWPLVIFALPGAILLLGGIAVGVQVVRIYIQAHAFSMGFALLTTLLSITGSLWLVAGIILYSVRQLVLGR